MHTQTQSYSLQSRADRSESPKRPPFVKLAFDEVRDLSNEIAEVIKELEADYVVLAEELQALRCSNPMASTYRTAEAAIGVRLDELGRILEQLERHLAGFEEKLQVLCFEG